MIILDFAFCKKRTLLEIQFTYQNLAYRVDLSSPIDISIPLKSDAEGPNCFYAPPFHVEPLRAGDFVGAVREGAPVNFYNVSLNPHGNGTHTECIGHISEEIYSVNKYIKDYHSLCYLQSIEPYTLDNGDRVIQRRSLEESLPDQLPPAVVIRTMPNHSDKKIKNYSGANPPFFAADAIEYLVKRGVQHLLVDLPSLDKEKDGGKMLGHKAFWQMNGEKRMNASITEMVFVEDRVLDGLYLLNLQFPAFELDAAPSRPLLFHLKKY